MLAKVINNQGFCKAIRKYIGIADLFNYELVIGDQFFNTIVLNINVFGSELILGIFSEDDTSLIISI